MMNQPLDDHDLVDLVRRGSPEALGALYARYGDRLMAVAYRLTVSSAEAEDVLHDVFLGLPEALGRYEERGALAAWLGQLTARTALTRLRAPARRREVPLGGLPLRAPGPTADLLSERVTLAAALGQLPDSLRAVLVLKLVDGHSHARIAELLGITVGASEVRLVRALRMLRHLLRETP